MREANWFAEYIENTFQPNEGEELSNWKFLVRYNRNIRPTLPKEIKTNIDHTTVSGFDLTIGEVLK